MSSKTRKQQLPEHPIEPEIEPNKDLPEPTITPEIPEKPLPIEKPEEEPMPEIEPQTDAKKTTKTRFKQQSTTRS